MLCTGDRKCAEMYRSWLHLASDAVEMIIIFICEGKTLHFQVNFSLPSILNWSKKVNKFEHFVIRRTTTRNCMRTLPRLDALASYIIGNTEHLLLNHVFKSSRTSFQPLFNLKNRNFQFQLHQTRHQQTSSQTANSYQESLGLFFWYLFEWQTFSRNSKF